MLISNRTIRIAFAIGSLSALLAPAVSRAQPTPTLQACAKRSAKAFLRYSGNATEILGDCRIDSLKDDERADCRDAEVWEDLEKAADKLRREVRKCNRDALRSLCPHGQRDDTDLMNAVLHAPTGTTAALQRLDEDLWSTPYVGCPRPERDVSRSAENCADRVVRLVEDGLDEIQKCVYKCELTDLRQSGPQPCIDLFGEPIDPKVEDCLDRVRDDLREGMADRCSTSNFAELGCPLDLVSPDAITAELTDRLLDATVAMANGIFRSSCAGGGSGGGGAPAEPEPVPATLYPSQKSTVVSCGLTLGPTFFGTDDVLRLDGDLDCGLTGTGANGLVVATSNVSIEGRSTHSITGPSKTTARTGTGILVAPGASNVTLRNFRAIERYGVGVADSGNNSGLVVRDLTVRRNRMAGVRVTSSGALVDGVRADRNAVGFDLSGDGATLVDSEALRSQPEPHVGIWAHGLDKNGDGRVVRVNRCIAEENGTGILVADGPQLLEDNVASENLGDGIHVASVGSKIEDSTVKRNGGHGIVVSGDANQVTANRSDENSGDGYVVIGERNDVNNNRAGSLTDLGNLGSGFRFGGFDTRVESNQAEANHRAGFVVAEDTARFANNRAVQNRGRGFEIAAPGNRLDTNVATGNGVTTAPDEFWITPGNVDGQGNRSNGATFSFGPDGGLF